jgi:hypothetical protein
MAKKTTRGNRRAWTKADVAALKQHSRNKSPVTQISRLMKRSPGAIRQKALALNMPVGHRR